MPARRFFWVLSDCVLTLTENLLCGCNGFARPRPVWLAGGRAEMLLTQPPALTTSQLECDMAGVHDTTHNRIMAILRGEDVAKVPLGGGKVALIDVADLDLVSGRKWWSTGRYAYSMADGVTTLMHKLILPSPSDLIFVDHIDGDGLNNQRHNLRLASHKENMRNRKATGGISRFKGVWLDRAAWRAEIQIDGKKVRLGSFAKERDAARAYDKAACELHGDFAKTNADLGLY